MRRHQTRVSHWYCMHLSSYPLDAQRDAKGNTFPTSGGVLCIVSELRHPFFGSDWYSFPRAWWKECRAFVHTTVTYSSKLLADRASVPSHSPFPHEFHSVKVHVLTVVLPESRVNSELPEETRCLPDLGNSNRSGRRQRSLRALVCLLPSVHTPKCDNLKRQLRKLWFGEDPSEVAKGNPKILNYEKEERPYEQCLGHTQTNNYSCRIFRVIIPWSPERERLCGKEREQRVTRPGPTDATKRSLASCGMTPRYRKPILSYPYQCPCHAFRSCMSSEYD